MPDLATVLAGFSDALSPLTLLSVMAGVFLGQFVGALPGLGPVIAMAVVIPFTFVMSPLPAIGLLIGIMKGGSVGGAIPAILINIPGTPDAAATSLDGHPMAKAGKGLKAMKLALFSSVTGDTFSDLVLITVSIPLAIVALMMGPVEIFALMIFSFAVVSGLLGQSPTKGLIALVLGLLCATIGADPLHTTPRFIFGHFEFFGGLPIAPMAIGALAVSEIFRRIATAAPSTLRMLPDMRGNAPEDSRLTWREYWACRFVMLRGALIGTGIGAVPGVGSTAAAFISYAATREASKDKDSFGRGNPHGVAATESANSAVTGADMIPLLSLGIPGSASAAMLISAFIIQGIQPGPMLFEEQGRLVYGLLGTMLLANMTNTLVGMAMLRFWARVIMAPQSIILAVAMVLCLIGAYLASGSMVGIWVLLAFALIGYAMTSFGYPVVVFIIAFFLGPRLELSLVQTLIVTRGDLTRFVEHPIALVFLLLSMITLGLTARRSLRRPQAEQKTGSKDTA